VPFVERLEPANKKTISQQRYARADAILKIFLGEIMTSSKGYSMYLMGSLVQMISLSLSCIA
jgi:hypothetical protein